METVRVPVDPSEEMLKAVRGFEYHFSAGGPSAVMGYVDDEMATELYKAMLSVVPSETINVPAPIADLAMMLRRMIWQIRRRDVNDDTLAILAGKAADLLRLFNLQGNPLRDEVATPSAAESGETNVWCPCSFSHPAHDTCDGRAFDERARDRIGQLKHELSIALAGRKDAWIKVSDRLPKIKSDDSASDTVIIIDRDAGVWIGWLTKGGKWRGENWGYDGDCGEATVTHWQPLPAAPDSGQAGK